MVFFPLLPTALNFTLFIFTYFTLWSIRYYFYKVLCISAQFISFTFFPSTTFLPLYFTLVIISFVHFSHWFTHTLDVGPPAHFPQPGFSTNGFVFPMWRITKSFLHNVSTYLPSYTLSHTRRQQLPQQYPTKSAVMFSEMHLLLWTQKCFFLFWAFTLWPRITSSQPCNIVI